MGIIISCLSFKNTKINHIDRKYVLIALMVLLLSVFVLKFPYNIGIILLITGIIIYFLKSISKKQKILSISYGISLAGLIFLLQTALIPIFMIISAHFHRIDYLSPLVSFIGNLLGLNTSVSNGIVFIQTTSTYAFTTTLEKLGFFPWALIFTGTILILFLCPTKKRLKNFLIFLVISGIYLILRYITIIYLFLTTEDISIFWNPFVILISFIPLVLLLMHFIPIKNISLDTNNFKIFYINKRRIIASLLIFIFVFFIIGSQSFQDPGIEKKGRILIDEKNSNWEKTTTPLDKEWYGQLSTYNYYNWAEWLNYYYTVDKNINKTLNSSLIGNYDILIVKCPTNSFSEEEILSIVDFVKKGGGLYVIGDHTNVFGMNFYANNLLQHFDISFNYDSVNDISGALSVYKTDDTAFTHPIVRSMSSFDFHTSCSIQAPIGTEYVIIGNKLAAEPGTYSTKHFFRESSEKKSPDIEFGFFLQTIATKYGKGRVVVFSDSTCFSNFCMFKDGYTSFNLGVINYLNRSNNLNSLNLLFFLICILSLGATFYFLKSDYKIWIIYIFLIMGLLAFVISSSLFTYINDINYSLPNMKQSTNVTKICFLSDHSDIHFSSSPHAYYLYDEKDLYGTFFVWTQRLGHLPSINQDVNDATEGDAIVIINPTKHFKNDEINNLYNYVVEGGKILVIDSIFNSDSTANDFLPKFGFKLIRKYNIKNTNITTFSDNINVSKKIGNYTEPYLSIFGGKSIVSNENNQSTISMFEIGEGKIVVMVDSYTFSDAVMGGVFTVPDSFRQDIYNTEFYIFEDILFN